MDINNLIQVFKENGSLGLILCMIYFMLHSEITIKYYPSKRKKILRNKKIGH
jgi:hypothetical protein